VSEDHDDFAFEPIPGLPEHLPRGETMLWQGSPDWLALAISAFHVRKVGVYFALLLAWEVSSAWRDHATYPELAILSAWITGLAACAIGILCLLAYLYARGTIYTLTSKRIVIRTGLALPVTLNLPLALIETASVGKQSSGTGNIALDVCKPNRIAWMVLWPNVRPWTMTNPQPLLRGLADVETVAPMLANALAADSGGQRLHSVNRGMAGGQSQPAPSGATLAA
jgi:Bacterial PH domain